MCGQEPCTSICVNRSKEYATAEFRPNGLAEKEIQDSPDRPGTQLPSSLFRFHWAVEKTCSCQSEVGSTAWQKADTNTSVTCQLLMARDSFQNNRQMWSLLFHTVKTGCWCVESVGLWMPVVSEHRVTDLLKPLLTSSVSPMESGWVIRACAKGTFLGNLVIDNFVNSRLLSVLCLQ